MRAPCGQCNWFNLFVPGSILIDWKADLQLLTKEQLAIELKLHVKELGELNVK